MSYFEELTAHYKQVRARLDGRPAAPWVQPQAPDPAPAPEPAQPPRTFGQWIAATDAMGEMFRDTLPIPTPIAAIAPSTARQIAREALAPHGMTWADAMSPARTLPYTAARAAVYKALRKHGWSLMKIAIFCGRDHTTIMNALHPRKDRTK